MKGQYASGVSAALAYLLNPKRPPEPRPGRVHAAEATAAGSGQALIRVDLDGTEAAEGDQWDLGQRIREVEQAPDGTIWLLTDEGQVLRLIAP